MRKTILLSLLMAGTVLAVSPMELSIFRKSAEGGIAGSVLDADKREIIRFESRVDFNRLEAEIIDAKTNQAIGRYIDLVNPMERGSDPGKELPVLRVGSWAYKKGDGKFAGAPELSEDTRQAMEFLALELPNKIQGADLRLHRQALEIFYQAIYEEEDFIRVADRNFNHSARFLPEGCRGSACTLSESEDYILSASGGFAVKRVNPELVLERNYLPLPALSAGAGSLKGQTGDPAGPQRFGSPVPSAVGDCNGRCGAGCGSWSFSASGPYQQTSDWGYFCTPPPSGCSPLASCYTDLIWAKGWEQPGTWTASGNVTAACQLHDDCVRNSPLGLADPFCNAVFGPPAAYDYATGAGTPTTWSHAGWGPTSVEIITIAYNSGSCNGAGGSYPTVPCWISNVTGCQ